jgi:predicted nucleotidyltransferase
MDLNKKKSKLSNDLKAKKKFWLNKSIVELLEEDEELKSFDVNQLLLKDVLNPDIWLNEDTIRPEVRKVLLKNALGFINFTKINTLGYKDIIFTGSLANYNYTDASDLDVHILMDTSQITNNQEFLIEYLDAKKDLWKNVFNDIKVKNHDVELYVQDVNEFNVSSGIYSLMSNKWLVKPIKKMINIDTNTIEKKASYFMKKIDKIDSTIFDNNEKLNAIHKIKDKIKKLRQSGLNKEGELSIENLVFKVLRNTGYLAKLMDMKQQITSKELSLESIDIIKNIINE